MRAAISLDLDLGWVWLGGLLVFTGMNAIGFWMDPGRADKVARDHDPRASSASMARLGLLIVVAQLPAVTWRLVEGDPETRVAKAWVVESVRSRIEGGAPDGELPASYAEAGVSQVEAYGRTWLLIQRSVAGSMLTWSYDVERGRWRRGRP